MPTEFLNSIFNTKTGKIIFFGIGFLLLLLLAVIVFKIMRGDEIKIAGFEVNARTPQSSSINTTTKPDSTLSKPDAPANTSKTVPVSPIKNKNVFSSKNNQKADSGSNQVARRDAISNSAANSKNINFGTNNGHIGDTYVERELQDADKNFILQRIDTLSKKYGVAVSYFEIIMATNTNLGKFASQMADFLQSKGYSQSGTGQFSYDPPLKGIMVKIDTARKCVSIHFGVL